MKFVDYLLSGAPERIKTDMRSATADQRPYAFATALAYEVACKAATDIESLRAEISGRPLESKRATLNRAFAPIQLTAKRLDSGKRVLSGTATTPRVDRVGDIIEPMGGNISLPCPLLLQHDHANVIGKVTAATPTASGIRFKAEIPTIEQPGRLKDRVDEAWHLVQYGLISTVSIGFRATDAEQIKGGGLRFTSWDLLELSLVSIPANPDAVIETHEGKSVADAYEGSWRVDQSYQRSALATHRGNLWLALTETDKEPGKGPAWKMVSKSGGPPQ